MEIFFVVLLYVLTFVWALHLIVKRVSRGTIDFWVGFTAGTLYFIYVPLGIILLTGSLQVPLDFAGTSIPDVLLELNAPQLLIVLGMFAVVLAYVSLSPVRMRSMTLSRNPGGISIKWYLVQYLAVSAIVYILSGLGDDGAHWYRSKEDFLLDYGLFGVLLVYSISALRISLLIFTMREFILQRSTLARVIGLLVVICAVDLYTTGNRIFTLLVLVTLFIVIVKERRYGWLLTFVALTPVLAYFMSIFRWIRSFMHSSGSGGIGEVIAGFAVGLDFATTQSSNIDVVDIISGITESVNLNVLVGILDRLGNGVSYLYGETLFKTVVFWIPRSIWATKPDSITTVAGNIFAPGDSASLVTTFYGELFANFGVFSFVLLVPVLMLSERICRLLFEDHLVRSLAAFVLGFIIVRMPISDMLLVTVVLSLLIKTNRFIGRLWRGFFLGARRV